MDGAQALVRMLENHGITHVFGITGAKVDSEFIALLDSSIELVLCRHGQNAAFMAQAMGRITGKVGVCLVTSGPGVTNLVTGLATATSEGDPVLAIGAEVPLDNRFKHTHQALDGVDVIPPATKCAESELTIHSLPEIFGNAVRAAESGRPGAAFLGFPKDVGLAEFPGEPSIAWGRATPMGADHPVATTKAAELIDSARQPVLLLGMQASQPALATSLQSLSQRAPIPYCATFQGTGLWASPEHFVGRVGLFRNHRADRLLDAADCVITVGFDAIEYDSSISNTCTVVAIDVESIQQGQAFLPTAELIGDLAGTLDGLAPQLNVSVEETLRRSGDALTAEVRSTATEGAFMHGWPIHPPRDIYELQQVVTPETTV